MRALLFLKKIQFLGTEQLSDSEKKSVMLVNSGCLFMAALCFAFIFPWLMKGNPWLVLTNALMVIFYCGLIWLNSIGQRNIPKFAFIIFLTTANFVAADMMGRSVNYHFSMIPVAGFCALLFEPHEKKKILFAILYPMTLLAVLLIFDFGLFPNKMENSFSFMPHFDYFINGIILCATTFYLLRSRNQAETKLDHARAQAMFASKMSSLGEMAGAVSHEIKTPLSHMMNLAQLFQKRLSQGNLAPEKANEMAEQIITSGEKISGIIDSLNALYHPNTNTELKETCLKTILDDVLVISSHRLYLRSIRIDIDLPADIKKVQCNQIEIGQVIINLINNAIDALEGKPDGKIRISACSENNRVRLHVENNGPAIPQEVQDKMFEDFFTTKEPGKGTGLGLSISRKIMERNLGRLFLDQSKDITRFVCEFSTIKA